MSTACGRLQFSFTLLETTDEPSYNVLKLDILNEVTTKMNNTCRILWDKIDQDLIKVNEGYEMVLGIYCINIKITVYN